jgi:hypothetical protein
MRLRNLIFAIIVLAIIGSLPTASHAISASIVVNNQPGPSIAGPPCDTTAGECAIDIGPTGPGGGLTFNGVTVVGQAVAQSSGAVGQIFLRSAQITNNTGGSVTVTITYAHDFPNERDAVLGVVPLDPTVGSHCYGGSLGGNFFRPPFAAAAGNSVVLRSFVTYTASNGSPLTTDVATLVPGICGTQMNVFGTGAPVGQVSIDPAATDPSLNNYGPPAPDQVLMELNCRLAGGGNSCLPGQSIRSEVTMTLTQPGDSNSFASPHTVSGRGHVKNDPGQTAANVAEFDAVMKSFTCGLDAKDGNPPIIQWNNQGNTSIALLGSADCDVHAIDYRTVTVGPNEAPLISDPSFREVNKDSFDDAIITVSQPATGITCADRTLTVKGEANVLGHRVPFSASTIIFVQPCR